MIIVWGKKISRRRSGVIADFCPFCRDVAKHRVVDLVRVGHLYYIPLGSGDLVVHEVSCDTCKLPRAFLPDSISPEPDSAADLTELAARTSPRGLESLHARVEVETRIPGNITPDERIALIAEPFGSLDYALEHQRRRGPDRSLTAIFGALALAGLIGTLILFLNYLDNQASTPLLVWTILTALATLLATVAALYRAATAPARIANSKFILQPLARSLRPLSPTLVELQEIVDALKRKGSALGRLDPTLLHNAIISI